MVKISVVEVRGKCALNYRKGDSFEVEAYYIKPLQKIKICLHALNSMLTLLMPFLKGISAKDLGIGYEDNVAYFQCPDPGQPYTCGGTVVFKAVRKPIGN